MCLFLPPPRICPFVIEMNGSRLESIRIPWSSSPRHDDGRPGWLCSCLSPIPSSFLLSPIISWLIEINWCPSGYIRTPLVVWNTRSRGRQARLIALQRHSWPSLPNRIDVCIIELDGFPLGSLRIPWRLGFLAQEGGGPSWLPSSVVLGPSSSLGVIRF